MFLIIRYKIFTSTKTGVKMYELNYWILAAVGITAFLLSIIWYSPLLWGSIWQHYRNIPNPNIPQWTLLFGPLREIIVSGIIAILLLKLHINTCKQAAFLMFVFWIGGFMRLKWLALFYGII